MTFSSVSPRQLPLAQAATAATSQERTGEREGEGAGRRQKHQAGSSRHNHEVYDASVARELPTRPRRGICLGVVTGMRIYAPVDTVEAAACLLAPSNEKSEREKRPPPDFNEATGGVCVD